MFKDVPTPTIGALRTKQKMRELNGGRDRREADLAADAERLIGSENVRR